MELNTLYTAEATSKGGRNGHVTSSDGVLDLDVKMPKGLGGPGGNFTNPEQLFAAGYASCFGSAIGVIAKGRDISDLSVTAKVSIGKDETGGFGLATELLVSLPKLSKEEAEKLVNEAHQVCPYSKATRGNMNVKLSVQNNELVNS